MSTKIPLDLISVASPCSVPWDSMKGDDRTRFCEQCSQHVYNLSELTKDQAETLVNEAEGRTCVRYFRRFDGTVMTTDCPVGWRAAFKQKAVIFGGAAVAITIAFFSFFTLGVFASVVGNGRVGGGRIPNPIHVIEDIFFPRAIAGEVCLPPQQAPAPKEQPPQQ